MLSPNLSDGVRNGARICAPASFTRYSGNKSESWKGAAPKSNEEVENGTKNSCLVCALLFVLEGSEFVLPLFTRYCENKFGDLGPKN